MALRPANSFTQGPTMTTPSNPLVEALKEAALNLDACAVAIRKGGKSDGRHLLVEGWAERARIALASIQYQPPVQEGEWVTVPRDGLADLHKRLTTALSDQEADVALNGLQHPGMLEPMRDILHRIVTQSEALLLSASPRTGEGEKQRIARRFAELGIEYETACDVLGTLADPVKGGEDMIPVPRGQLKQQADTMRIARRVIEEAAASDPRCEGIAPALDPWIEQLDTLASHTAKPSGAPVPPFGEGGVGNLMCRAADEYLEEYVLSTEGADHTPTEFERELLQDFFNGLISDERFFGPVRALLNASPVAPGPVVDVATKRRIADELLDWAEDCAGTPDDMADAILALLNKGGVA